jgi:hypothetical protein
VSNRPAFRADLARSVRLLRAFRGEQADPSSYYAGLASDTVGQLGQYADLDGRVVADVGGGPGFFVREPCSAGARAFCVDAEAGELVARGRARRAAALAWVRSADGAVLVDAVPRYLPGWTRWLVRVPVLREFLTWNLLLVLRIRP